MQTTRQNYCIRLVLTVLNFVLFITGIFFSVGSIILIILGQTNQLSSSPPLVVLIVGVVLGVLLAFASSIGFLGTRSDNKYLLWAYCIFYSVALILTITLGSMIVSNSDTFGGEFWNWIQSVTGVAVYYVLFACAGIELVALICGFILAGSQRRRKNRLDDMNGLDKMFEGNGMPFYQPPLLERPNDGRVNDRVPQTDPSHPVVNYPTTTSYVEYEEILVPAAIVPPGQSTVSPYDGSFKETIGGYSRSAVPSYIEAYYQEQPYGADAQLYDNDVAATTLETNVETTAAEHLEEIHEVDDQLPPPATAYNQQEVEAWLSSTPPPPPAVFPAQKEHLDEFALPK